MSDLIDRQAAIDAIEFGITYARAFNKETGEVKELFKESNDELRKAVERIKQLQPIQPEIVRCEECKYHHQKNCPIEKYFSLDGFCSRGKRREVTT